MHYKLLLTIVLFSTTAHAASFNCDQASTKVEKLICSNTQISKLDEELSSAYKNALAKENNSQQLKNEQRAWIKKRNSCIDSECLIIEYKRRISELRSNNKKPQQLSYIKEECSDRPECWPEGSAMHTGLTLRKEEQDMMKKVQVKHEELIALISIKKEINGKEYLADERLVKAVKAQQAVWEDYKYKECELIGALSGGASTWKSARSVNCALNLTTQRYKRLRDAVNCVKKIPLKNRQYNLQNCLFQIAPLAVPLEK